MTTFLVRGSQIHQNYLGANVTANTPGLRGSLLGLSAKFILGGASADSANQKAAGMLYRGVQQQAALLSYADNFRLMGFLSLLCIPLVMLFRRAKRGSSRSDVIGE